MIAFSCQKCGKQFQLKPEFAGRKTTCSGCKEPIEVPSADSPETIAPPAKAKIAFCCTRCGMKFSVMAEFAGRATKCPTCKEALVVPSPDATIAYVPSAGKLDGTPSSLARADVDGGVTLGAGAAAGISALQDVMDGKSGDGARYVIETELARGGMGAVLRAIDCDIRREVAVKYLLDQTNTKNKSRFVEEAQITGQLEHPNIVPIHEIGLDSRRRLFFSMKMVKGRSLAQILKMLRNEPALAEKEYGLSRLLNILVNVCNALAYAHSRGVVHRDLKPANIMVGDFGEVYVMDWGLAKVLHRSTSLDTGPPMGMPIALQAAPVGDDWIPVASVASVVEASPSSMRTSGVSYSAGEGKVVTSRDGETDLTRDGAVLGTPVYMPPEQAAGRIEMIDERSDIYSLGAILYEILTFHPPIDREGGFVAIVHRVTHGEIVPPEKRAPERAMAGKIPPELAAVAMKALATKPAERYQTVDAFRADLHLFLEGRSVSAKQDNIREMAFKLMKRNKGVSVATAAATAILAVVGVWSLISILTANSRTRKAYDDYVSEQKEKIAQAKRAVPSYLRASRLLIADRQLDDALAQLDSALNVENENEEALFMRAQIRLSKQNYDGARADLEKCLQRQPNRADAQALFDLIGTSPNNNAPTLFRLAEELTRQKAFSLAAILTEQGQLLSTEREGLLKHYRARLQVAGSTAPIFFTASGELSLSFVNMNPDSLEPVRGLPLNELRLTSAVKIRDLSPLKGMPLKVLNLAGSKNIVDLTPLKGMPLTLLDLNGCTSVETLAPLENMPLKTLDVSQLNKTEETHVLKTLKLSHLNLNQWAGLRDISFLKDMPLTTLKLGGCPVDDLSPLKGMSLTELWLGGTIGNNRLRDLTPLQGMPLQKLSLAGCGIVSDFSPLKGLPLTYLEIQYTRFNDLSILEKIPLAYLNVANCMQIRDLTPLRGMKLVTLKLSGDDLVDLGPLRDVPIVNLDLINCPALLDLKPLKAVNLAHLKLTSCNSVRDLSPLEGLPLVSLEIRHCGNISDMTPLRKMEIENLTLVDCTKFTDLTPVSTMTKLKTLNLMGTPVRDLSPLRHLPLMSLILTNCTEVRDLTPLADLKLVTIGLPPDVSRGMEVLRNMRTLTSINGGPANQFWRSQDKGNLK